MASASAPSSGSLTMSGTTPADQIDPLRLVLAKLGMSRDDMAHLMRDQIAHEMGHVIARHAELREKEEQQVDLVSRVVNDVVSDPEEGALALAKSKLELASFSQKQEFEADAIGIGIAARAGYYLLRGGACSSPPWSAIPSSSRSKATPINPAAPEFLYPRIHRPRNA